MSDVAREVGVSLMTVSRVINNKGDVSSETRQRILEIISELGYRPSAIARSLATKEMSTIGLVIPDVSNPFFAEVTRAVEHLAYSKGYHGGYKRIGTVSGPPASYSGAGRRRGFLAALREVRIELLAGWIRPCQPSVEGGHEAPRRLLGMYAQLTALFCFNDLGAAGAPQLLAIKIDDLPLDNIIHRPDPFIKDQLKLLGIDSREDPPKHIVRRKAIRQHQKGLQPRQISLPKQFNIYPAFRSADHRTNGNPHDLN
jgi:DNA-binding LacI/PurR family transcriptional regulator